MNECRGAREEQEEEVEEGEGEQERPDLPSRMRTLFRSRFPPSPHRPLLSTNTRCPCARGQYGAPSCTRWSARARVCVRAHVLAHALVRVLNNAYGDRGLAPPRHTRSQSRFVWTRKTTLYAKIAERERERALGPLLLIARREERKRERKSAYNARTARGTRSSAAPP